MLYSTKPFPVKEYVPIAKNYYALREEWINMTPQSRHLEMCAFVAGRRKQLMFTGQSACAFYNIPRLDKYEMRPNCISEKVKGSDVIRWHYGPLDVQAKTVNKFLVAGPIRTLCDLAKYDDSKSLLVSINHCLNKDLFNIKELSTEIENQTGMRNRKLLQRLLRFANDKCESPLETIAWIEIYNAGFVLPQQQVNFYNDHKFLGRVDMYWEIRNRKIVLELDGKAKLFSGEDLFKEKRREDQIRQLGCEFIRVDWDEVKSGELVKKLSALSIPTRRYRANTIPT